MRALIVWVWLCVYLNCAGWALSLCRALNPAGYAVVLLAGGIALSWWLRKTINPVRPLFHRQKLLRRFRRPFPMTFLVLAAMAALGGILYGPNNYDAMAYRIPRVLNWLAEGQWHWIHTIFPRLNDRVCGDEWITAPLIALTNTDRLLFVINIISFLLLPGLIFSVFTRLGVRPRVAWYWMWLVPSGYCFVLQAGSNGNDLFGAVFVLAAMDFALRAKKSQAPFDFFMALLAAAMMTSAKVSNLPLLLPVAAALLFSWKVALRRPLLTAGVGVLALSASAFPTMVFNQLNFGNFLLPEMPKSYSENHMALRTAANLVLVTLQNAAPPVFPLANAWNREVLAVLPPALLERLHQTMAEQGAAEFRLPEMQMEESAGLGFGLTFFLPISLIAAWFLRPKVTSLQPVVDYRTWLRWLPVIAFLAVMTQGGLSGIGRLLTPFYALILPVMLTGAGHEKLARKCWWQAGAFAVFACAGMLLVIAPPRPLFPVITIMDKFHNVPQRIRTVYSVYHDRNDSFAPARAALPPEAKIIGLFTYDDPETSLWRPFGSRRILHVCPQDTRADLKQRGIEYVLLNADKFPAWFGLTPEEWAKNMNAEVVRTIPLNLRASDGPRNWVLLKLN